MQIKASGLSLCVSLSSWECFDGTFKGYRLVINKKGSLLIKKNKKFEFFVVWNFENR